MRNLVASNIYIICCHAPSVRRKIGGVNSAFIIAAWIADVWVNPVKSHVCTHF